MIKQLTLLLLIMMASLPVLGEGLSRYEIKELQERLLYAGFPAKGIDGVIGPETLNAIKHYTGNVDISRKDVSMLLEQLRAAQSGFVLIEKKQWEQSNKKVDKLAQELELVRLELTKTKEIIKEIFLNNEKQLSKKIDEEVNNLKFSLLVWAITALAGAIGALYGIYTKLKSYALETLEKHVDEKKTQINDHTNLKITESQKDIETHFRSANAKSLSVINYATWLQLDFYKDKDETVYKQILQVCLNLADRTIDVVQLLPDNEEYIFQKVGCLSNVAYYFVDQNDKKFHGKAKEIVDNIGPLLVHAKMDQPLWIDHLENVIYVEYRLKLKSNEEIKGSLENLFYYMDESWTENVKKRYPDLFSKVT